MSHDEPLTPEQVEAYRRMSPAEKLETVNQLYWAERRSKVAAVREQHPGWSEEQVEDEVRRIYLEATIRHAEEERRTFMSVRDDSPDHLQ